MLNYIRQPVRKMEQEEHDAFAAVFRDAELAHELAAALYAAIAARPECPPDDDLGCVLCGGRKVLKKWNNRHA